jgi:hypothetical protein
MAPETHVIGEVVKTATVYIDGFAFTFFIPPFDFFIPPFDDDRLYFREL